MGNDSRERMIRSAASLIASRGFNATSFSDVLADSGAPRGSIYHHFPDGKRQLAEDAVRWTSDQVLAFQRACAIETGADVLTCFIGMWRRVVVNSDATSGCVVAGVAIDTAGFEPAEREPQSQRKPESESEPKPDGLVQAVRDTFRAWVALLAQQLESVGLPADRAASIAMIVLAGMEGALILCRAEGGVAPLDAVAAELLRLVN
jgi:TetR/AcrR family transcriptional repressor of lmrAB and yxaGH operons